MDVQGVNEKLRFFFHECSLFCWPLLPHTWAGIGCTEIAQIGQPVGVTVHSRCLESFENLLQRHVGEAWVAVDNEKRIKFFSEHPEHNLLLRTEQKQSGQRRKSYLKFCT